MAGEMLKVMLYSRANYNGPISDDFTVDVLPQGGPVANQDLFRKALRLERQILDFKAHIAYIHVYREDNEEANELANKACDVAERQYYGSDSGYDSDY